jgi:hypothetical protein
MRAGPVSELRWRAEPASPCRAQPMASTALGETAGAQPRRGEHLRVGATRAEEEGFEPTVPLRVRRFSNSVSPSARGCTDGNSREPEGSETKVSAPSGTERHPRPKMDQARDHETKPIFGLEEAFRHCLPGDGGEFYPMRHSRERNYHDGAGPLESKPIALERVALPAHRMKRNRRGRHATLWICERVSPFSRLLRHVTAFRACRS